MDADRLSPHLDDSALFHLVDQDAHPIELARWNEHVDACQQCRGLLERRRRQSALLSAALSEHQLPVGFPPVQVAMEAARARAATRTPAGRARFRPWMQAAAAILIVLAPLVLVPSVRAALVDWIREGWSTLVSAPTEPTPTTPRPDAASGFTLFFTPATSDLRITIDRPQEDGELVLVRSEGVEGSLTVGGAGAEALVTEDGLRIRNDERSGASFRITIPAAVGGITVQIGAGAPRTVTAAEVDAGWSTPLR